MKRGNIINMLPRIESLLHAHLLYIYAQLLFIHAWTLGNGIIPVVRGKNRPRKVK